MKEKYSGVMILFGGGLDSCAMVEMYQPLNPTLVFFDYGQKAFSGEFAALQYFTDKYQLSSHVIKVPASITPDSPLTNAAMATDHDANYMPGRNLIFSALAFSLACKLKLELMLLGASPAADSSVYNDAKTTFAQLFNAMTSFGYPSAPNEAHTPELRMPLLTMQRLDYVHFAYTKEPRLFDIAFSCYESKTTTECGQCTHCKIKAEMKSNIISINQAYKAAGVQ